MLAGLFLVYDVWMLRVGGFGFLLWVWIVVICCVPFVLVLTFVLCAYLIVLFG